MGTRTVLYRSIEYYLDLPGVDRHEPVPDLPGAFVYFLWQDDELLYVGQTADLRARVGSTDHGSKPWTRATWIECDSPEDALRTETESIRTLKPMMNFMHSTLVWTSIDGHPLLGTKLGKLLVLDVVRVVRDKRARLYVRARCDCGKFLDARLDHIQGGHTSSCGCDRSDRARAVDGRFLPQWRPGGDKISQAKHAILQHDGLSDREIAKLLGISNSTVSLARKRISAPADAPARRTRKRPDSTAGTTETTPGPDPTVSTSETRAGTPQQTPGTPPTIPATRAPGLYEVTEDGQTFRIRGLLALAVGDELHSLAFDAEDEAVLRVGGVKYTITRQQARQRTTQVRANA